ncbi:MAG TPA: hypothetical protein VM658_17655 [bacterium]|nr:hypothetical protein [bacterium]
MKLKSFTSLQAAIQGGIFLFVGTLFSVVAMYLNFRSDGRVSPLAMTLYITMAGYWAGTIAGVGGINAARKDWQAGKISLTAEEAARLKTAKPPLSPLWLTPFVYGMAQTMVIGALAAGFCFLLFPDGLPLAALVPASAVLIGGAGALSAKLLSGRQLFRYLNHPRPQPVPYGLNLFREHIINNVLANIFINATLGFALYYAVFIHPEEPLSLALMIVDTVVVSFFVSILVPAGTSMQAESEAREKWTALPKPGARPLPGLIGQNLRYVLVSEGIAAVFIIGFVALGMKSFDIWHIVAIKGIHPAVVGGVVGAMAAYWGTARGSQS